MAEDIRWKQRFQNYKKALDRLIDAVTVLKTRELSYLEKQGFVQAFEFTFDLSWKVLKDFLLFQGNCEQLYGSRDSIKKAYSLGLISSGDIWLEMIKSRNLTSHIYDEKVIDEIIELVFSQYVDKFIELRERLEQEL